MEPAPLRFAVARSPDDPLEGLQRHPQGQYLRWYLADLGARSVLIEDNYFDRDYLSEFAAFYCTSSAGYRNCCQRLHYFSERVTRDELTRGAAGDPDTLRWLQEAYLGFVVRRPIPGTPFGRTVLRWYPEQMPRLPRITEPSRTYHVHIAGIELIVRGLAWQQQDQGVGACATVALWSMLHSSALDDRHVIPTTAEVTQTAHRANLSAGRPFPSDGLTLSQMVATVRDSGFAPLVVSGSAQVEAAPSRFEREHFCASFASLVRSGYPVLIVAQCENGLHAVCGVGFRQAPAEKPAAGRVEFEDAGTQYIYVHDDNLGPSVRVRVTEDDSGYVVLRVEPPAPRSAERMPDPTRRYFDLIPVAIIAAAHDDVRITPDDLNWRALDVGLRIVEATGRQQGVTLSSRIVRLTQYVGAELERSLRGRPEVLARTRLALWEEVPPMSLHLAVIRVGYGAIPLLDILYDTTDSLPNMRAFCHVAYHSVAADWATWLRTHDIADLGVAVHA